METSDLLIECRAEGPFMKNGYILGSKNDRNAVYIDPGDEAGQMISYLQDKELSLQAVIATHGHMDHVCGIAQVREKWDVPIYLHPDDEFIYSGIKQQAQFFGLDCVPAPPVDHYLRDEQELEFGEIRLKVYHTPGHSPGGVCLETGDHLFTGDLIFAGSVGRTDLPGGDMESLMKSIRERIVPLPKEQILWPGHGPRTTVGEELKNNPFRNSFLT